MSRPASSNGSCVLIVGASSGIGRAVAHRWATEGSDLILAGRDLDDLNLTAEDLRIRTSRRIEVARFDALAFDTHAAFFSECLAKSNGQLAGVILLHGYLPVQADAQRDIGEMRKAIETNYTSAASVLMLAANEFESKRNGFVAVFSSVAGDRGRQSNYVYGSAKAGLTCFLDGLRVRLFKVGVCVTTIKPGFVDTAMTWGLPGLFLVASPEKVADDVYRAVSRGKATIYTPWFWRWIMQIIKLIPNVVFNRMKM